MQKLYTPLRNGTSSVPGGPAFGRVGDVLAELFPEAPAPVPGAPATARITGRRWLVVPIYIVAIVLGAMLSLARYDGVPPWQSVYAEDYGIYLVQALAHPWRSIFYSYAGYEQLVPRLIGQFVSMLPLHDAAVGFAVTGALIASACAVFVFYASAGHVSSTFLRVLLGLSVLLLPVALQEIANAGVNTPWYLLIALFWALLWRPRTKSGLAVAALIGFAAASSNITAVVFVVLLAIRLIALPRVREHAVTAGWAAGCLVQLPYFLHSSSTASSRLSHLATPAQVFSFYGHDVLLPAFGWHVSWLLRHWVDRNYGVVITGGLIAVGLAVALVTGTRRVRVFTVTAMAFGFVFAAFASTVTWWVTVNKVKFDFEPGARYTCLPILLITAVAVVAIDAKFFAREGRESREGRERREDLEGRAPHANFTTVAAAIGLVVVLCLGWIPDFRYTAHRTEAPAWAPTLSQWVATCRHQDDIRYVGDYVNYGVMLIPCSKVRGQ